MARGAGRPVYVLGGKHRPAKAVPPPAAAWLAVAVWSRRSCLPRWCESVFAGVRQIGAVFVVHFLAGDRRVEGADQAHVFGAAVQGVTVVLVEGVQGAVGNFVHFTGGKILDAAVTGNTVNRFQMVLVPEGVLGASGDDGFVERETHAVFFQKQAAAGPLLSADFALGTDDVLHSYDFHSHSSFGDGIAIQYKHARQSRFNRQSS